MLLVGMYPTEWDLPKQEKEELMMLLGLSVMDPEKWFRQEWERLAAAEQARLCRTVPPAAKPERARPKVLSFSRPAAALT